MSNNVEIKALYEKIQLKKAALNAANDNRYVTNCEFRYSPTGVVKDIRTVRTVNELIEMMSFLIARNATNIEAAQKLGVEPPKFTWLGATEDQWANDLKIRATQINLISAKAELNDLEQKLLKIASPEFLQELELESIKAALA